MIRFRSCSSMAGLLALDVHATLAQGAVVTVHDVVSLGVSSGYGDAAALMI